MRSLVAYGIGALSAVAIGAAVAMGVNANDEAESAKTEAAASAADNVLHEDGAATWRQKISFPQHAAARI